MTQPPGERLDAGYREAQLRYAERIETANSALRNSNTAPLDTTFSNYFAGKIGEINVISALLNCLREEPLELRLSYAGLLHEIRTHLRNLGIYDTGELFTTQEENLIGGTPRNTKEPYKPAALSTATAPDISMLNEQRRRAVIVPAYANYFGLETEDRKVVQTKLQPLDEEGNTIDDPVPANEDGTAMDSSLWAYSNDFPFRRKH